MEITCNNVNDGFNAALWYLHLNGVRESSRNGEVIVAPEPVLTTYKQSWQRVLFWQERDQNPFFTLLEAIWMIAGRNDVEFVKRFNSRMGDFSDDGVRLNGAYGHRWRRRFGVDQLVTIIHHLQKNPESRRAVLTMWGVAQDLSVIDRSKDVCCNSHVYFDLRGGKLNMTVCCRSNDAVWGCYGANAVHFSFLQEFMAHALDSDVGVYRQFSNNLHAYQHLYDLSKFLPPPTEAPDNYYLTSEKPHFPIISTPWEYWLHEAEEFCINPLGEFVDPFFNEVAKPMVAVWQHRKTTGLTDYALIAKIPAWDWRVACRQWLERREDHVKEAA